MNIALWVVQIILALKFISTAYTHGLGAGRASMQRGVQRLGGAAQPLLIAVGVLTFLGALGLILPGVTNVLTWITPWSAALLALLILAAIGLHFACRERPNVVPGVVLFALAAFVAYGRWVLAPL